MPHARLPRAEEIKAAVTIPVMAKCRIGHFVECQILQEIGADYIDESEVRGRRTRGQFPGHPACGAEREQRDEREERRRRMHLASSGHFWLLCCAGGVGGLCAGDDRVKVVANPWRTHILDGRHGA